jgi:hypothetical protein
MDVARDKDELGSRLVLECDGAGVAVGEKFAWS